jgi:hypothetical protein
MHANMLTVEAAVEETFGVRSARLKELATPGYHPSRNTRGAPLLLYPTQRFYPRQVHPILSTLLLEVPEPSGVNTR